MDTVQVLVVDWPSLERLVVTELAFVHALRIQSRSGITQISFQVVDQQTPSIELCVTVFTVIFLGRTQSKANRVSHANSDR